MANEGSTKPSYEELERALGIMTEKYKAEYGYVESAREERDQIAKTCDLLRAENLRVRGLLQRGEWVSTEWGLSCPICHGFQHEKGHTADCKMAAELKGAESANIGKLDTADKSGKVNRFDAVTTDEEAKQMLDGRFDGSAKSGVEMGKENRVDEKTVRCQICGCEVWDAVEPGIAACASCGSKRVTPEREVKLRKQFANEAGSAETGGEKAEWISVDERMPEDDDKSVWVCFENGSHYCSARYIDEEWFGYDLQTEDTFHIEQKITHWRPLDFLPTSPRPSQNQTVSSGVEGAHEGNTADKDDPHEIAKKIVEEHAWERASGGFYIDEVNFENLQIDIAEAIHDAGSREPEKLNNAQKVFNCSETEAFHRAFGVPCSKCEPALSESSLSSPPPRGFCIGARCQGCAQCQ